ncbi:MAG: FkbM family methyltransferase [Verrucomicrobiae bacterium]|nr:FkbM family methyltransferase [Verrucomicrobiae bacterium]
MSLISKTTIRRVFRRRGYDIVSYSPAFHTLARRRRFLDAVGVDLVLDVGANVGQYASQLREIGYAGKIVSFEPVTKAYKQLRKACEGDPQWIARNSALGDVSRKQEIKVSQNLESSSLLPMLSTHLEAVPESAVVAVEQIVVERLDEIIDEVAGAARRIFLKMDTQGYERMVVEGALGCLDRIVALQAEVSLVPLYEGETALCDFTGHLSKLGYSLAAIEPGYADARTGRMYQVDCVFFRPEK